MLQSAGCFPFLHPQKIGFEFLQPQPFIFSQAHELSDSIFNHMFRYESAVQARRRALMLVDVLVVARRKTREANVDGSDYGIAQKVYDFHHGGKSNKTSIWEWFMLPM